jgi:fructose-1-phosphate kinase PfkB-like protein
MFEQFTVEEVNMMFIFDTRSRDALIAELSAAIPEFIEPGLDEIAENVLVKLNKMTDAEFAALELYPEYEDYESEVQPDGD